jgi:hypothetical protein
VERAATPRIQRHRNWPSGHDHLAGRNRPGDYRPPGARPPVTDVAGGGMRHHPPAWRRAERCGALVTFTPEAMCQIMASPVKTPRGSIARSVIEFKANWPGNPSSAASSKHFGTALSGVFQKAGRSQAAPRPLRADTQTRSRLRDEVRRYLRGVSGGPHRRRTRCRPPRSTK